jgi:hypothetical protein
MPPLAAGLLTASGRSVASSPRMRGDLANSPKATCDQDLCHKGPGQRPRFSASLHPQTAPPDLATGGPYADAGGAIFVRSELGFVA